MKTKKLVALLLAVVMVLGLGTTAFASSNEKVQINNMMVDASLVETQNEDVAEMEMVSSESTIATAAFDPSTNPNFAPIKNITVDWSNSTVEAAGAMQGRVRYNLTMPGAAGNLTGRTLTFTFSNRTSVTGNILVTMGGNSCSAAINESATMQVDLTAGEQLFTVEWNDAGTQKRVTCSLYVTTPEVASVNLTSLTVASTPAIYEDTTVGAVTRYSYTATLPTGTATTVLDAATVVVVPQNSSATMTLKNSDGTVAATGSKADGTYTFSNVNFNAGTKTLTVTDGTLTRDYQVSASIIGQDITVYVAFRGYLADQWLNGKTDYYDYGANGYGDGSSLSASDSARVAGAVEVMASMNGRNEPQSVDSATGRPIFAHNSYIEVTLTVPTDSSSSGLKVYDALLQAISNYNNNVGGINPNEYTIAQHGADNNYVDYMTFDGYELGEFDCGSASGWMYTARTSRTDVASALPNAGLKYWPISNGMYIDWYCTAAYGADFGYSMFDM